MVAGLNNQTYEDWLKKANEGMNNQTPLGKFHSNGGYEDYDTKTETFSKNDFYRWRESGDSIIIEYKIIDKWYHSSTYFKDGDKLRGEYSKEEKVFLKGFYSRKD